MVGNSDHAVELRRELTASEENQQTPRERLETALDRINDHLDTNNSGLPATGDVESDR